MFQETVDDLPGGSADWFCIEISITGNRRDVKGKLMKEVVQCYARDPVKVVADLLGNPAFKGHQKYAPYVQRLDEVSVRLENADAAERERVIDEMASAEWWARL